ncbi:MAG: MBOAT family O-acyltransferase [Planctomycetota bacterium]|jgi:D-alanyl-lipoteichoic acid acyltransferase DltB (MBOAT superfamily)
MLFQSWIFLFFFLVFYAVYLAVKRTRFKNAWILIGSYIFYGWWEPWFLILIAYSTLADYAALAIMQKSRRRKIWLLVSIINNLALLVFFKYSGFITENVNLFFSLLGTSYKFPLPGIFLPVGLSFYIFKSIGYVVDCYRGEVEREKNIILHGAFVSFFPILLAGPVERAKNLLGQLRESLKISGQDVADGFSLFIVGLFKKVALADCLALYVDKVYDAPGEYQSAALIVATFAFGWQIYFDFSGYSDMARGIGRMMGFRIMLNFNNPYLATGLGDFWRRWHISLSSWFRDYVYIPLGGNRKGKFNAYRNIFLTMVLLGFWHGAAWTFIIWGALHAVAQCLMRELERSQFYEENVPKIMKQVFVFAFVTFAWIFFRAASWDDVSVIVTRIFTTGPVNPNFPILFLVFILSVWLYQYVYESRARWILRHSAVRTGAVVLMILYLMVFASSSSQAFIYLQF